eukprot:CAMPEP_0172643308 /NCGR_PEP_ID=MMETSP1068-20121228/236375_1 /TAXON_ID=35684 /ORGANISM="Pseudopedinella elastica, Strain CCMP716" /LENGTH=223 /DNA_ID=CAMNT_0013457327 /DNA_START=155 /DNA_END=822 /DNA_ORIENTATION=-
MSSASLQATGPTDTPTTLRATPLCVHPKRDAAGYSEGDGYVLGGTERWADLSDDEKARLRARRAKAGVKCDGCGLVGFWRRNCPNCSVAIERDREARRAPAVMPRFVKLERDFGVWATQFVRFLCVDKDTGYLTRQVGFFRIAKHVERESKRLDLLREGGDKTAEDRFGPRLPGWIERSDPWGELLRGGTKGPGKLSPELLQDALVSYRTYFYRAEKLAAESG